MATERAEEAKKWSSAAGLYRKVEVLEGWDDLESWNERKIGEEEEKWLEDCHLTTLVEEMKHW